MSPMLRLQCDAERGLGQRPRGLVAHPNVQGACMRVCWHALHFEVIKAVGARHRPGPSILKRRTGNPCAEPVDDGLGFWPPGDQRQPQQKGPLHAQKQKRHERAKAPEQSRRTPLLRREDRGCIKHIDTGWFSKVRAGASTCTENRCGSLIPGIRGALPRACGGRLGAALIEGLNRGLGCRSSGRLAERLDSKAGRFIRQRGQRIERGAAATAAYPAASVRKLSRRNPKRRAAFRAGGLHAPGQQYRTA